MASIIFCFILGERKEAAMARTHLAVAFAEGGGGGGGEPSSSQGHTGLAVKTIAIQI